MPTDPQVTGLGSALPPSDVTILAVGEADKDPAAHAGPRDPRRGRGPVGWQEMPAEVLPRLDDATVVDPSKYAVARQAESGEYVGLLRVARGAAAAPDRADRGPGRPAAAAASPGRCWPKCWVRCTGRGRTASAEVNESNLAATALFERVGARRDSSNLEVVLHG